MSAHQTQHPLFLDHIFVLTESGAEIADRLTEIGWNEGNSNEHPGQGTANRRFFLERFTLEFLYISNPQEASTGAGRELKMLERSQCPDASPFGLIVRVTESGEKPIFQNWEYFPDYFGGNMCFYVGVNSTLLREPACICMPLKLPDSVDIPSEYSNPGWTLTSANITTPVKCPSQVLAHFAAMDSVEIEYGKSHQMILCFNEGVQGKSLSLHPVVPVTVEW